MMRLTNVGLILLGDVINVSFFTDIEMTKTRFFIFQLDDELDF